MDVPKDVQQQLAVPDWDEPMSISAYISRLPPPPEASTRAHAADRPPAVPLATGDARSHGCRAGRAGARAQVSALQQVVSAIRGAAKPVIYYGGGCQDSRDELREFAYKLGLPVTSTLMVSHQPHSLGPASRRSGWQEVPSAAARRRQRRRPRVA